MKKDKPTLLITMFMGMSYRNYVMSGLIDGLSETHSITLLVRGVTGLNRALRDKGFTVEKYPDKTFFGKVVSLLTGWIEKFNYYSFYHHHLPRTVHKYIERDREIGGSFSLNYYASKIYNAIRFNKVPLAFHYRLMMPLFFRKFLNSFDQILLLSTELPEDRIIMANCQKGHSKLSAAVHSWDNLPARGHMSGIPDTLLVWNHTMKDQAIEMHGVHASRIKVMGVPQFYYYRTLANHISKEKFLFMYGINDPSLKIVTYTCSASRVFPDENLFIELLISNAHQLGLLLIVRLHPSERKKEYTELFSGLENVILDTPGLENAASYFSGDTSSIESSIEKYVALIKHTDVLISLASTTALDAIIFDTPVICPQFNISDEMANRWNSAFRWYESTHFQDVVNASVVYLAENKKSLYDSIVSCIDNPQHKSHERNSFSKEFCLIESNSKELFRDGMI